MPVSQVHQSGINILTGIVTVALLLDLMEHVMSMCYSINNINYIESPTFLAWVTDLNSLKPARK